MDDLCHGRIECFPFHPHQPRYEEDGTALLGRDSGIPFQNEIPISAPRTNALGMRLVPAGFKSHCMSGWKKVYFTT